MANVLDRNFDFLTNGTVTAAGLHNLIDETNIYAGLISTQEEKTTVGTSDLLLVADSSSIGSPQIAANRTTVYNLFDDALTGGTYANAQLSGNLTYGTATGNRTISTSATITNGTITNGVIPTGTFGTTTSTAATITTGTIPALTAGTTTSTAANITTGTLTNLVATTSTFNGTITGSTNIINIGSGQIYKDSSGNVGIGTTSPAGKLDVYNATNTLALVQGDSAASLYVHRASTDALSPNFVLRKSRGSVASAAAVATGDNLGNLNFIAFGGTNERTLARVRSSVEAYVSDTDISSNLTFFTSSSGGVTATERLRIASAGQIGIGGANYGTSGQVLTSGGTAAAPSWSNVTIGTNSVTFPMLSTSSTEADNAASRVARAWVNWNGTGTVAIRSDFNVSSITDHATGKYGVNFTVDMSDANYAVLFSGGFDPGLEPRVIHTIDSDHAQTTSAVRVNSMNESGSQKDSDRYGVVVFD